MRQNLLLAGMALFPISEIALALVKRSRGQAVSREDRGSMRLLWLSIFLGMALAHAAQLVPSTRIPVSATIAQFASLALLLLGLAVRWTAIITLGRFFTVDVAIQRGHAVVQHGLYGHMRHPSYTGLIMAFLGVGMITANWLSIIALLTPIILAVLHRVAREEQALLDSLGSAYAVYCARTKRFIPHLF